MMRQHSQLLQEPWGFAPEQIANLTRWQVEELYLNPAIARQAKADQQSNADAEIDDETAESFAAGMLAEFPTASYPESTAEKWQAAWHQMRAEQEG